MTNETALQSMGQSFAETLALVRGIAVDRVKVTLAMEPRDGKDGVRIDVAVDGEPDPEAEKMVLEWLRAAAAAANQLMSVINATPATIVAMS